MKIVALLSTLLLSGCVTSSYGPQPDAWCGWWMRQQVAADPGPDYNVARKWARYGSRADEPCVGCLVVYPHHIAKITGACEGDKCPMISGNDGKAVRERTRSLRGKIAIRRP